ncbi:hypothetical protein NEOKW01_1602 [Nematocida sp. AWRm80]|nr:hypothetical protein NEOKW01_1602 [Nematocida sp. AWRm80]
MNNQNNNQLTISILTDLLNTNHPNKYSLINKYINNTTLPLALDILYTYTLTNTTTTTNTTNTNTTSILGINILILVLFNKYKYLDIFITTLTTNNDIISNTVYSILYSTISNNRYNKYITKIILRECRVYNTNTTINILSILYLVLSKYIDYNVYRIISILVYNTCNESIIRIVNRIVIDKSINSRIDNKRIVVEILFRSIYHLSKVYWDKNEKWLITEILNELFELDPNAFHSELQSFNRINK